MQAWLQAIQVLISSVRPVAAFLTKSASASNGVFQMMIGGDSGPDYSIYSSTNLASTNWNLLLTTNPPSLPFLFKDPTITNSIPRFYRVLLGP